MLSGVRGKIVKSIVVIDRTGEVQQRYSPISPINQQFTETLLQKLVFEEPRLLSTEEVDSDYSNLISLCREVPVRSGSIDALYITPEGRTCLVETKLWRNPEAHRTVIARAR
jgi:hypothetical protein